MCIFIYEVSKFAVDKTTNASTRLNDVSACKRLGRESAVGRSNERSGGGGNE